jgi:two-component system NtrC family sensor kinase
MHDTHSDNWPDLLCVELTKSLAGEIHKFADQKNLRYQALKGHDLQQLEYSSPVVLAYLDSQNLQSITQSISQFKKRFPASSLLIFDGGLHPSDLSFLYCQTNVLSTLNEISSLESVLQNAFDHHQKEKVFFDSLIKVRRQNKILESLKDNLEDLVYERTKEEFATSRQMESSVKEIQSLLNFIKNISRQESIDDLMLQIKNEFRKVHGLMPPLLILEVNHEVLRLFFFQGKQLIEKTTKKSLRNPLQSLSLVDLKTQLMNDLGRPFGPLSAVEMNFQSEELDRKNGLLIFEHTLEGHKEFNEQTFSQERWPVINMALESLLLKEGLQEIAKQWSRTFNEMKDPIIILSKDFQMSLTNSQLHRDRQKSCFEAFAQRETPCVDCPVQKTFETGEPQTSDVRINDKIYRVHSYPIHLDNEQGSSHVINQYVDVTQSLDLQSRVIQGEKMAAVGLLAGNIAHELNNPLTGIHSLSELLLEDLEKDTTLYKDLTEVMHAAQRCQRIIKDLLDFTEVGQDSRVVDIDINQMVGKTLPLLKMAMRTLNSDISLSEKALWVHMNPQLLQQVLFNLINNACQAMDENGYLYVVTRERDGFVEISIRDTGVGIPDEIAQSIFDPFFTTKDEGKGTGLGLSMSKSVVERFGGSLILNNKLDEGAEFVVRLPQVEK